MRTKYLDIVKILETRVRVGDYALANMPGERRIAEEFGVSHMTARRAVKHLVEEGVLSRPKGRQRVARPQAKQTQKMHICFIFPGFHSLALQDWSRKIDRVVTERGGVLRCVSFMHEDDPVIMQALRGEFTGFYIVPPHRPSQLMLDQMARNRDSLVTLWHDYTDLGIPCIEAGSLSGVDLLIDHLVERGHRRIDCLNTQPDNLVVRARINRWRSALQSRGLSGDLFDLPVEPFGESGIAARDHMRRLIETHRLGGTAMFCVTTLTAVGACRACRDMNIDVGDKYAICGFGELSMAQLHSPSITIATPADIVPYLNMGLDWIVSSEKRAESLNFSPSEAHIWIGESTGLVKPPAR